DTASPTSGTGLCTKPVAPPVGTRFADPEPKTIIKTI
ncbi:unnamed protein product, partial [Linum tenue]